MATKKQAAPAPKPARKYTGFDRNAKHATPGILALRNIILFLNAGTRDLGTYAKRDARGKPGIPSVHQTGRACDIGYNSRATAEQIMDWLTRNADTLGIEMVIDYQPAPWGRAWRCDRQAWRNYDRRTIAGAPGGQWFHIEISPDTSTETAMTAAIEKALGQ